MSMTKSYAARHAQLRRDHENAAREDLESLIPSQYFSAEIMGNSNYNKTTKVLMAMTSYLQTIQTRSQADDNEERNRGEEEVDTNDDDATEDDDQEVCFIDDRHPLLCC